MRHGLLILLGLLVVTWFEFQVYPGHSYLAGETELMVPMLERLDTPGFLSRDLVAANPTFAYTIYDEITQSIHVGAKTSFEQALLIQQILFRFASVLGVFLLARALKVSSLAALLLAASVNAITHLAAPESFVTNPEPTPESFAVGLILLASGLVVNRTPLLAGLAGGLALLYNPVIAAAFWLVLIAAWICDRSLRRLLTPTWPALLIFSLILGNLVQLQAGLGTGQELTAKMSDAIVHITQIRTPWVWVSNWFAHDALTYLFLLVAGVWAITFVWKQIEHITRWITLGLALSGALSVAVSMGLLSNHYQFVVEMTPARNLSFSVAIPVLLCGAASWHASQNKQWSQSLLWMTLIIAAILNAQVLDLLHSQLDIAEPSPTSSSIKSLAKWADQSTWGSSLFQFPDSEKSPEPGVFRALSRRALWADWSSGIIADYSKYAGLEWWKRWQNNVAQSYSPEHLENMLALPIDYYVLRHSHSLRGIKPAYSNSEFVVYDAQDLREVQGKLKELR